MDRDRTWRTQPQIGRGLRLSMVVVEPGDLTSSPEPVGRHIAAEIPAVRVVGRSHGGLIFALAQFSVKGSEQGTRTQAPQFRLPLHSDAQHYRLQVRAFYV